jgi:hypothetical protein
MIKHVLLCAATTLAINGCAQQGPEAAKPRSAPGHLELLKGGTGALYANLPQIGPEPSAVGQVAALDDAVDKKCLPPPRPPTAAFVPVAAAAVASVVVGWVIDYLVSQASAAAQRRVAEYSAVTSGGLKFGSPQSSGFYSQVNPPIMEWSCVRLTHRVKSTSGASVVAMEAILKLEPAASQDFLVITPLRLYFDQPVARTDGSTGFGVSVGATFDALWQASPTGEGKSSRVWSPTVLSQKIEGINWKDDTLATTRQRFYYYNVGGPRLPGDKSDASNVPLQVPLVPWSVTNRAPYGSGTLTVTFNEVADPPAVLKFVAGLLKDHGKEIGDFLKDAAKKAIPADGQ